MKLNNKTYDIIKWVVIIVLPAIAALYSGLVGICGLTYNKAIQLIREMRWARD